MSELSDLIARHSREGFVESAIPGLTLSQTCAPSDLYAVVYYPLLCVLARGRKRVFLGEEEFHYDPDHYLVASVDLPVRGQVLEAPCYGVTLALDPAKLAEAYLAMSPASAEGDGGKALAVNPLGADLLDPLVRLLRLLDRPEEIPMMAPLLEREILYRLLRGPRGAMLRQMALPSSQLSQISRAIRVIRERFDQALRMEDLARTAGMSSTSFHRHFRAITAMSPLQYQKRIRLQEARRILHSQEVDAARVSFDVGYESPSQFSREYRRLFGAPPAQDAVRARQSLAAAL